MHDEGSAQAQGTLVHVMMTVTENASAASLKNEVEGFIQRSVEPSESQASQDMAMRYNDSITSPVLLDRQAVCICNFFDET